MTALRPGASPPPVAMPMQRMSDMGVRCGSLDLSRWSLVVSHWPSAVRAKCGHSRKCCYSWRSEEPRFVPAPVANPRIPPQDHTCTAGEMDNVTSWRSGGMPELLGAGSCFVTGIDFFAQAAASGLDCVNSDSTHIRKRRILMPRRAVLTFTLLALSACILSYKLGAAPTALAKSHPGQETVTAPPPLPAPPAEWVVHATAAAGSIASTTRATGGTGVQHVIDCISATVYGTTNIGAQVALVNL